MPVFPQDRFTGFRFRPEQSVHTVGLALNHGIGRIDGAPSQHARPRALCAARSWQPALCPPISACASERSAPLQALAPPQSVRLVVNAFPGAFGSLFVYQHMEHLITLQLNLLGSISGFGQPASGTYGAYPSPTRPVTTGSVPATPPPPSRVRCIREAHGRSVPTTGRHPSKKCGARSAPASGTGPLTPSSSYPLAAVGHQ